MNTAGMSNLVFLAVIVGVFYFLIIRPQQKRTAAQRDMLAALKPGDEIVTVGGIFAEIIEVGERVRVRVADGSEFEIAKQAVGQIVQPKDGVVQQEVDDQVAAQHADDQPIEVDESAGPDTE